MRRINAGRRTDLHRFFRQQTRDLRKLTEEMSGANSEPVRKAANHLRKHWRAILYVQGAGKPAAPGSPPHTQTESLMRSIGSRVVDGVRRVGSGLFTSRLHEFGYKAKDGTQVPPRPHGRPALEIAAKGMTEVLVSEAQRRIAKSVGA